MLSFLTAAVFLGRLFLSLRFAPSLPSPWALFWSAKAGGRAITNIDFILTCLGYFYLRVNSGRGEIQAEKC